MTVSVEQASAWVRNFNPLLVGSARWPTRGGIYEPLVIWNAVAGAWVPWLATDFAWAADHLKLTLHTRDGGQTFDVLTRGLPQQEAYDLVFRHGLDIDATGNRLVFGSTTGGLWITEDQGDSWSTISEHLPPIDCVRFV